MKRDRPVDVVECISAGLGQDSQRPCLEEKLRCVQEDFREVVRQQQGMIFAFRKEGDRFVHTICDGELLYRMEMTPEQVVGKELHDFLPKHLVDEKLPYYERAWQGEDVVYEVSAGNGIQLRASLKPIKRDGRVIEVIASCVDITEWRRTERRLKEEEQRYKSLFEHNLDLVCSLDLQGRLVSANNAFYRITGYRPEEVNHKPLDSLVVDEDKARRLFGLAKQGVRQSDEFAIRDRHDWRIELNVTNVPIIVDEAIVGVYLIAKDVTEQKRAEESLQESEQQLRTLINAMPDFICLKDGQGRWLDANEFAVQLFQLEGVDYKGKKDSELAEYSKSFRGALKSCEASDEQAWAAGHAVRIEEMIAQPDGSVRTFDVSKVPIFHASGKRQALVVIGRDIADRKKTEDLLRKSDKLSAVGELAAGVAHEIRNPLTALKGFIQLLRSSESKHDHYFEIMLSELDRINSIVGELLLLAKPQVFTFEQKNVISLLKNVISLLDTQAIMRKVEIRTAFEVEELPILCVENQLKQVFINLLKNALEAMPQSGGEIMIRVGCQEADRVIISIIDQGCGIPEDRLPRLGEPFYTTKEKGTGLGLMVSYKIIQDHQGTISFSSQIGKGTKVDIVLPIS
ncbi:PAS domain S-box protein [Brevibacillus humidisoli]|uniref:PAS domain S-box protein n=1 Tax=Brevibacillus humidisoli TaxID=2895522 RepID=UPI001E2B12D8|nr:PAS domain S-box protein [Brevibacillus humidisoli]UFJ39779.1 PAS domain S-box protein [Brevibacillus humidisoli]